MEKRRRLRILRHAAWPVLALAVLAALAPLVSGQEPPPAHSLDVLEASLAVFQVPPFDQVGEKYDDCTGTAGNFEVDPVARNITFEDQFLSQNCGEAQVVVQVPTGATSVVVNFSASRHINQQSEALDPEFSMVQEFRLYDPQGPLATFPYYDPQEGDSPAVPFELRYTIPAGASKMTLGWFFEDEGATFTQDLPLPAAQQFVASITNLTVRWPSVPLAAPHVQVGAEVEHLDDLLAIAPITANVTLAPGTTDGRGVAGVALALVVDTGPELQRVVGPAGPLDSNDVDQATGGGRLQILLDERVVAAQGEGTYSFEFLSARVLAPIPPPSPPSRVYPFFLAMLLLPIPAAVLAMSSANAYRREAEGPYVRTARLVLAVIILIAVYYLIIAYFALFEVGPRTMAVLPPPDAVLLVYSQLLLVLILLVGIAILQARARTGAMRRDIEERRRKEDRLRRSNEELERFAYVASHDLQEPLRKVAGFTALLQKRYGGRLDKDADEIIQYAVDGASRMQMLIKDILAYSRVGSKELNRVPVDVEAVMELVVADLGEPIQQAKADVRWDALPTVRADASQLRQVLQNLVENAIKYRHPKRRPKVEVSATSDLKSWHFAVSDNGQGIPDDKHDEIFGIFRRLHGQSVPGTGIGLAVCKKAIERHDGRIWVESAVGKGSTFHFTLPRSMLDGRGPSAAPAAPPAQAPPASEGSSAGAGV